MKSAPKHLPAEPAPVVTRQGHDELNFAEFPLVLLAKRPPAGMHSIEYQDDYTDPKGKVVTRKVTISGAGKYGLPNAQDEDVLIALMYLTLLDKQKLRPGENGEAVDPADTRTIHFTRPQLFQILGWPDTGDNYERLKKSLRRWKGVTIVYENWTFLTGSGERHGTDETGFSLLDNYELADGRSRPKEAPPPTLPFTDLPVQRSLCSITWNKTPFASFQSGYLKTLDLDRYFQLPTAAAKRAFRYLDKHLPRAGMQEYDLDRFACQHVGFSTKYKPSRLRQDVEQTIVRPLEQAEFIAPMSSQDRFPKHEGRYRIVFARAYPPTQLPTATEKPAPAMPPSPLLMELKRHDIGGKAARDLIAAHSADHIEQKIDYLNFLIETGERPKKPAGWLRAAIEQDYGPPAGYLLRAERHRQRQAAEEKHRRKEEERAACRRQEEREAAARKAERAHIDAYLNALTPQERKTLEEQAVAHADDNMRQAALDGSPLAEVARRILVDNEVLRVSPFTGV
ncbi:MAG TPA: replication initiator protein A [Gemmataceae bacterium]|nr:replication initiator protein A [Gemmataceae bacterium]